MIDIHREIAFGEIFNMTERSFDDVIFTQVFVDGLRLCRRFHDYQSFWHRRLSKTRRPSAACCMKRKLPCDVTTL